MRTELAVACLVAALMGATAVHAQSQPSAVEIFKLRDMCQAHADEFKKQFENGYDFYKTDSNYSLRTNHCYVLLEQTAFDNWGIILKLYDGNTKNILATTIEQTKGEKTGKIYDRDWQEKNSVTYDIASKYIQNKMATER